jgi:hypothetical protein
VRLEADRGSKPYLQHVKYLANAWPHLRILADFMDVGTSPMRWGKHFRQTKQNTRTPQEIQEDRRKRWAKTNVACLDYPNVGEVKIARCRNPDELEAALNPEKEADLADVQLRLWVVEDLSRDVIELFGSRYDVEPAFFREHILDYAWHNVRDYWRDPPNLEIVARKQTWTQVRFVRARYFSNVREFRTGVEQAEEFNIFRRPDDDENNRTFWDKHDAKIGLMRSRASFWLKRPAQPGQAAVGILLLDPTLKIGLPLWRGYRNWEETPSQSEAPAPVLPSSPEQNQRSFFEDFLYWARKPDVFTALAQPSKHTLLNGPSPPPNRHTHTHVPVQALLHLICAEWLTISDYIKTRLTQIDWEIAYPETFLRHGTHVVKVDVSLKKLHIWRRYVPIFREMITETLTCIFRFPCHTPMVSNPAMGGGGGQDGGAAEEPVAANGTANGTPPKGTSSPSTDSSSTGSSSSTDSSGKPPCISQTTPAPAPPSGPVPGAIKAYENDFRLALGYMEEYQERIDRLTTVVTAVMSIADSRRALADNKNISQLTKLAFLFVPFSLVAAAFSMQTDVTQISALTVRWFFIVAIPVTLFSLGVAWALSLDSVQAKLNQWGRQMGMGGWRTDYGI